MLTLHLDASTLGLSNGAPCSTWTDSSSSGNNATSSGSARPTFAAGVSPSGLGTLQFTAASSQLMTLGTAVGSAGAWSCYIVYKKSSAGVNGVLLGNVSASTGGSAGQDNLARFGDAHFNIYFGSPYYQLADSDSAAWEVACVSHDGSNNVNVWLNAATGSGTAQTFASLDTIGHRGFGEFFDGYIAEILLYDAADSPSTLATNGAALYAKWITGATSTIPVTHPNFKAGCSPYHWYNNGTYAETNNAGASLLLSVVLPSGGPINLDLDTSPLAGASSYPYLRYRIGNGAWTTTQLVSGQAGLTLASGLSAGTYAVEVQCFCLDYTANKWNAGTTPYEVVRVTGVTVKPDASLAAPPAPTNAILFLGESIAEGLLDNPGATPQHDAFLGFGSYYAVARSAWGGNVSFGGLGFNRAATCGVPDLYNATDPSKRSWSSYHSGASRLVAGLLSPAPSEILIGFTGSNDALNSVSDANTQASVQGLIAALRAAAPAAKITVCVPFGGFKRAAITAGFNAAGDGNSRLVDLGTAFQGGLDNSGASYKSSDGIHPYYAVHAEAAARMLAATGGTALGSVGWFDAFGQWIHVTR